MKINIFLVFIYLFFIQVSSAQNIEDKFDDLRNKVFTFLQIRKNKAQNIADKAFHIHKQMIENPKYYYCQTGYRRLGKKSNSSFAIPFGIGRKKACRQAIELGLQISEHFLEETVQVYFNAIKELKRLQKDAEEMKKQIEKQLEDQWTNTRREENKYKIFYALISFIFKMNTWHQNYCHSSKLYINKKESLTLKYCLSDFDLFFKEREKDESSLKFLKTEIVLRLLYNASLNYYGFLYGLNIKDKDQDLLDKLFY